MAAAETAGWDQWTEQFGYAHPYWQENFDSPIRQTDVVATVQQLYQMAARG